MQDPIDDKWDLDDEPTSEVRSLGAGVRRLAIDTGLQGATAEAAWLTVTDDAGTVFFEGAPGADGRALVSFTEAPDTRVARIILETPRGHRQAVVELRDGWTEHAFAG